MIVTALFLAVFHVLCLALFYNRLPNFLRKFLSKHSLLTDFFGMIITWFSISHISSSITAAIATATSGVMIAVLTSVGNQENTKKLSIET